MRTLGLLVVCTIGLSVYGAERLGVFGVNRIGDPEALYRPPDYMAHVYQRVREVGGTAVRLTGSPRDIEHERGVRVWEDYDRDLNQAVRHGLEPLICVVNTPGWASVTGEDCHDYPYKTELLPEFEDFCRELAAHSRGRARIYQIWNEPNGCGWHCADGFNHYEEYVPMLRAAYRGLKAGDPGCRVFIGGLDDAEGHSPIFLRGIYEVRDRDYPGERLFDGLTDHPYSWDTATMRGKLDALRAILAQHGDGDAPVWITEYGWHSGETTRENQAELVSAFLSAFASPEWDFLEGAVYLSLADFEGLRDGFGLTDANLRPKPAYDAFQGAPRFGRFPPFAIHWHPLSATEVEVSWSTREPTVGRVVCAAAAARDGTLEAVSNAPAGNHRVLLQGLAPGAEYEFAITSDRPGEGEASRIASAVHGLRTPSAEIPNGDFEEGFFAGVGRGWRSSGEGLLTNTARVPDASPDAGAAGQAVYAFADRGMRLETSLWTFVATQPGSGLTLHARWAGPLKGFADVVARMGFDPSGGEDPEAEIVWTDWTKLKDTYTDIELAARASGRVATVFFQCGVQGPVYGRPLFLLDEVRTVAGP